MQQFQRRTELQFIYGNRAFEINEFSPIYGLHMTGNTYLHLLIEDTIKSKKGRGVIRKPVSICCAHHVPHVVRHTSKS